MGIPEEFKSLFDFMLEMAQEDQGIALVECHLKSGPGSAYVIAAVLRENEEFHLHPIARMLTPTEFDDLIPPSSEEGIVEVHVEHEGPA